MKFNTSFITDFNKEIDISWLEQERNIKSGRYPVEIYVNGNSIKTHEIEWKENNGKLTPCVPVHIFNAINMKATSLPEGWQEQQCIYVEQVIKGATTIYDYNSESLKITIPDIYLFERTEGVVDPSSWDEGINALSVNYSLSGSNYKARNAQNQSLYYSNLQTLLRLGAWRFTTLDVLRGGTRQGNTFEHLQAYAQRAIGASLSELSIGDLNTSGEIFDTTSLRGAIVQSDERMLPWTVKGYAPEIRGIAESNAVVTVKQNNNILYEKSVPPGDFNITNLNALGYGSDLEVVVTESNGTVKKFRVPYSSIPQLLRKGYYTYSVAIGQIRRYGLQESTHLLESKVRYGVSNGLTLYGGGQLTHDGSYLAINSGIAVNTLLGAISTELSQSKVNGLGNNSRSYSFANNSKIKIGFARLFNDSSTNISFSGYHQPGKYYYSLNDFLSVKEALKVNHDSITKGYRNGLEANLSQQLAPAWGNVSLTGLWERGYDDKYSRSSYLLSYKNSYSFVNYALTINRSYTLSGNQQTALYAGVSMPFGSSRDSRPSLRASVSYSNEESKLRTSVNGSHTGSNYSSNFNSYFSQSSKTMSDFGLNVGHTGSAMQKTLSYSQGMNSYMFSGSISGAVLIHPDGMLYSSWLGDTVALIKAPGGEGASILGYKQSKIEKNGFGVMPYLSPYEENKINLDTKGSPLGFDSNDEERVLIPTAGAVLKYEFKIDALKTASLISRIKNRAGESLPFGTRIYDGNKALSATVGQGGVVIISLPAEYKPLKAKWKKEGSDMECTIQPWFQNKTPSEQKKNIVPLLTCDK